MREVPATGYERGDHQRDPETAANHLETGVGLVACEVSQENHGVPHGKYQYQTPLICTQSEIAEAVTDYGIYPY
jgi:hypothetical protein